MLLFVRNSQIQSLSRRTLRRDQAQMVLAQGSLNMDRMHSLCALLIFRLTPANALNRLPRVRSPKLSATTIINL